MGFVLDTDIVPRLSIENMEYFRNEILSIISRISVPKVQILHHLVSGVSSIFFTSFTDDIDDIEEREEALQCNNEMLLYPKDNVPESLFSKQYREFQRIQYDRKQSRLKEYNNNNCTTTTDDDVAGTTNTNITMKQYNQIISLHPPGKIIHFVKTSEAVLSSLSSLTS